MSHDHDHPHEHGPGSGHDHPHDHGTPPPPETPMDPGAQALAAALKSSFGIVKVAMVVLVIVFLCSGFFTVGQQERAIVLRFGKPATDKPLTPGLKFALPYPIDEVVKVPITHSQRAVSTVGWYYTTPEMELAGNDPYAGPSLNPAADGYLITADQNIVHAKATMTYRIENAIQYIFGFEGATNDAFSGAGASNLVVNALNNALVKAASEYKIDDILYSDVLGFREAVRRKVVAQLGVQTNGVEVEQVDVTTKAPLFLNADFARVNDAATKRGLLINEAQTEANKTLSGAESRAAMMTNFASVESESLINKLKGEAARFNDLLPAYRANPDLFVQRHLTETLARVMTNAQEKIFVTESVDDRRWLLNREPQKINREQKP